MKHTAGYKKHLHIAKTIAHLLDTQFSVGVFKFGLDPLISLVPGIGSGVSAILSLYLFWIALSIGVPPPLLVRMAGVIVWDFVLGEVPVVGNIADFFYKGNIKNLALLEKYLAEEEGVIDGELLDSV